MTRWRLRDVHIHRRWNEPRFTSSAKQTRGARHARPGTRHDSIPSDPARRSRSTSLPIGIRRHSRPRSTASPVCGRIGTISMTSASRCGRQIEPGCNGFTRTTARKRVTLTIVDSNVLIDAIRDREPALTFLERAADSGALWSSVVVRTAAVGGVSPPARKIASRAWWIRSCGGKSRQSSPIRPAAWVLHIVGRHRIGAVDLIIAATAIELGGVLATLNVRDFPMFPGLQPPYGEGLRGVAGVSGACLTGRELTARGHDVRCTPCSEHRSTCRRTNSLGWTVRPSGRAEPDLTDSRRHRTRLPRGDLPTPSSRRSFAKPRAAGRCLSRDSNTSTRYGSNSGRTGRPLARGLRARWRS